MKIEKLSGTMENAYGNKLDTPINYEGEFQAYETKAEIVSANDMLSDDEVVAARNSQRRAAARQRLMQAALDAAGIKKPTLETSAELRYKNIYDALVAAGKSASEAESIAKAALQ
jgi:hypothetical protein